MTRLNTCATQSNYIVQGLRESHSLRSFAVRDALSSVELMTARSSEEQMSGTKTIKNNSNVAINVVLRGRVGAEPSGGSLPPVSGSIPAGGSLTLQYGSDSNPYLNTLEVNVGPTGATLSQDYVCTQRGGPGTLDNLFNAYSTLTLGYNTGNYGFALSGSN
jgi:hypothetical protein